MCERSKQLLIDFASSVQPNKQETSRVIQELGSLDDVNGPMAVKCL